MSARAPRFLAITGPTASGKTDLSLALAERVHAEIVSTDSRQVYRGMDVGTDKVGAEARARVPHHGLDLVDPDESYSAGRFGRDVRRWVAEIEARGNLPLLVGGTGFFLRAVVDPIFREPPLERGRVGSLRTWLADQPRERLERWVRALDPERAPLAIEGGPQRMGRTLEVALLSGRPLSWWHRHAPPEAEGLPGVVVVLDLPREEMDRRIDERVTSMIERGLVEEVRGLLAAGYGPDAPGMTGTGYREIAAHLRGERTLEEAVEDIRRATRQYARRQLTWFRNQLPASAVRVDATTPLDEQADVALAAYEAAGGRVPWRRTVNHEVGA
ncbi:MAG TPA: tRNA (adenosine(37)-N6)-dimethylallyltransferase MiaA [Longimicrobiales bacterium]|nr:tRNA (adenosine(37)-N6)-dimethylallyltransferase MiaA [Longimicrobiales bacterium]